TGEGSNGHPIVSSPDAGTDFLVFPQGCYPRLRVWRLKAVLSSRAHAPGVLVTARWGHEYFWDDSRLGAGARGRLRRRDGTDVLRRERPRPVAGSSRT